MASDRRRDGTHTTLDHGERVMTALTAATERLRREVEVVVAKGGITSAEASVGWTHSARAGCRRPPIPLVKAQ